MNISVIGSGHVGLVTGACFADLGHQVLMVDHDRKKIAALKAGKMPFYEPGLEELVHRGVEEDRLRFTTSTAEGGRHGTIIFPCVGTPARPHRGGGPAAGGGGGGGGGGGRGGGP